MGKSTLFAIALATVLILALLRFNYPKVQISGNYYHVAYFPNNNGVSFKSGDGKFIPVVKNDIRATSLVDSLLFITKVRGDTSCFIIDTRKNFVLTKGQNVIGPITKDFYLKFYSNRTQLKSNWNSYKDLK